VLQPQRALWRVPQPCTQRGIAVRGGSGRRYEGLIVQGAAVSCRLNVTKKGNPFANGTSLSPDSSGIVNQGRLLAPRINRSPTVL
jgi:hypothetical protein